jgi:hypothetical protein
MSAPHYHPSLSDGSLDRPRTAPPSAPNAEPLPPPDAGQVLLTLDRTKKGEGPERLQIAVKQYEGHQYLDLRIWWRKGDGTWLPSKRGITVRMKELADVTIALTKACRLVGGAQ